MGGSKRESADALIQARGLEAQSSLSELSSAGRFGEELVLLIGNAVFEDVEDGEREAVRHHAVGDDLLRAADVALGVPDEVGLEARVVLHGAHRGLAERPFEIGIARLGVATATLALTGVGAAGHHAAVRREVTRVGEASDVADLAEDRQGDDEADARNLREVLEVVAVVDVAADLALEFRDLHRVLRLRAVHVSVWHRSKFCMVRSDLAVAHTGLPAPACLRNHGVVGLSRHVENKIRDT